MKRSSPKEQQLIVEGRDILHRWALSEPQQRDERCLAVVSYLKRLADELPRERVLPLFIGSAAFAAVVSLAREGKHAEAQGLVSELRYVAVLGDNAEALAMLAELRDDLARYTGDVHVAEGREAAASALACFGCASSD